MKSTIRRRLAPLLAVVIATGGMSLAASATAQASTITNVRNGDCLGIQFWQEDEQARTTRCNSSIFQRWSFVPVIGQDGDPGTYYKIVNGYTDMCLDVAGARTSNWAQVVQWWCWEKEDNQLWKRERTFRGTDTLRARHTDKCLDISWSCNSVRMQRLGKPGIQDQLVLVEHAGPGVVWRVSILHATPPAFAPSPGRAAASRRLGPIPSLRSSTSTSRSPTS